MNDDDLPYYRRKHNFCFTCNQKCEGFQCSLCSPKNRAERRLMSSAHWDKLSNKDKQAKLKAFRKAA